MEVNKTKEAIKFVSKHIADFRERTEDAFDKEGCKKLIMEAKGVITLLQQGEALKAENVELRAYKEIVEKLKLSERDIDIWWGRMSFRQKSTIIKGGEHLCMPLRNQHYEEFWDDLTNDEKTKIYIEYKNT